MKMIETDLSLTKLFKMIKNLQNEIDILKVQIEYLQNNTVYYDDDEFFRCQCG